MVKASTSLLQMFSKLDYQDKTSIKTGDQGSYLYIQQICAQKVLTFSKIPGARNAADICTKGLASDKINEFVRDVSCRFAEGRADLASKL